MPDQYPGQFYDGRSAASQLVLVTPVAHGVAFELSGGTKFWWPFEETLIKRSDVSLTFEHGKPLPQSLVVDHPDFLAAMAQLNPRAARGEQQSPHQVLVTLGAIAAGCLLILVAAVVWGFPLLVGIMASMMPVSVERKIGEAVLESMAQEGKRCRDASLDRMIARLSDSAPRNPYHFEIYIVEDPMVNAFAAPGGFIVIYRGLLNKTRKPEEAAAVIAHEMQHVIQRHSVRGMMRGLSIWMAIALITGDVSGTAQLAGTLSNLHYQRGDEMEADVEGLRMLETSGIDPMAMVSMLEMLNNVQGDAPAAAKYFSTHPLTRERIDRVKELVQESRYNIRPLLPGMIWPPDRSSCEVK